MKERPKISSAPSWTSIFTLRPDVDPPGFAEAFIQAREEKYGWAVLTTRGMTVIEVSDWEEARRTQPYQWLNTHPLQPASVEETLELAKETRKKCSETTKINRRQKSR